MTVCVCRDDIASLAEASASLPHCQSAGIVTQEGRGTLLAEKDKEKTWYRFQGYLAARTHVGRGTLLAVEVKSW
jgi:hypothetical protein